MMLWVYVVDGEGSLMAIKTTSTFPSIYFFDAAADDDDDNVCMCDGIM